MGVENDYYVQSHYRPREGMRRMFIECLKSWGEPYAWPEAVRDLICERVIDVRMSY